MKYDFPKFLTIAAAAAFLSVGSLSAQTTTEGHPDVHPPHELDERVAPEHRLMMGETFRGLGTPPAEGVAADWTVGATVPGTIVRHPVPDAIIATVPDVRGYEYVVLPDGRTALVHPETNTIAMILD